MHGNATSFANDNGFDKWGYNQGANLFSGLYCNWALQKLIGINHDDVDTNDIGPATSAADAQDLLDAAYAADYISWGEYSAASYYNNDDELWGDTALIMKWNDAWPSEAGAWITNHMRGPYPDANGDLHKFIYFTKIVLVPEGYYKTQTGTDPWGYPIYTWFTDQTMETEVGPEIWGSFATIESIYNDPYGGYGGVEYLSEMCAGFGAYK